MIMNKKLCLVVGALLCGLAVTGCDDNNSGSQNSTPTSTSTSAYS